MSVFDFIKSQLIDIIEWNETQGSDLVAWRFPRGDNEIKNGAKLIVREGQIAILVNMGQLADVFKPGMHTLETKNIPLLSTIMGWKYGFESPFKCEVYFLSTRRFMDLKWGTTSPVMMRDREFGMVRVLAHGSYAIQVNDAPSFLRELLATQPNLDSSRIADSMRPLVITRASDALASSGVAVLDMAAHLDELSKIVGDKVATDLKEMGLAVPMFFVQSIKLPEEVEKMLDKRTSMGMLGDMNQYMRFQAANAMEAAANNPSGGGAGLGAGLGAGVAVGQQMMSAFANSSTAPAGGGPPPLPTAVQFYAAVNGQQQGPMDMAGLQQLAASGGLKRETLVWRAGMANWSPAGQVPDLAALFAAMPPPLPS